MTRFSDADVRSFDWVNDERLVERLKEAMEKAGLAPQYVVHDGEGHGWQKVENRVDFWNRVERFLGEALK